MAAVPAVSRWWRTRSATQRIDLYTRYSYYVTLVLLPPMGLIAIAGSLAGAPGWALALVAASALATAAAGIAVVRASLDESPSLRAATVALVASGAVSVVASVWLVSADPGLSPAAPWAVGLPWGTVLVALSVSRDSAWLWRAGAVGGVASGAAVVLDGGLVVQGVVTGLSMVLALVGVAVAFRFSVWVLEVVREMDRTRGVQARLAVAEERLRFSRDLHDVMGRNLSAIAVKSQLAGELLRRGKGDAAAEIDAVARIAEDSLREVREVVRGYRATDLTGELAGARAVLRAAGVDCTVTGEDVVPRLGEPTQVVLGWVVREAVTNVLRHSRATVCGIVVADDEEGTTVSVTNDGAHPAATASLGSGLTGLSERLAASGGSLRADLADSRFTLEARVPR